MYAGNPKIKLQKTAPAANRNGFHKDFLLPDEPERYNYPNNRIISFLKRPDKRAFFLYPKFAAISQLSRKDDTMAKAKKLPSGSWRCQVYDYTDDNGKRHYESFTFESKKEAEYMAAEFAMGKQRRNQNANLCVKEALSVYCKTKEHVLSQTTLMAYGSMARNSFSEINDLTLKKLTSSTLQAWVNKLSASHSPKTVHNVYGYLTAVLDMYTPDLHFKVTLPQKRKPSFYVPSDSDIQALMSYYGEKDKEMLKGVLLAAFGTLRRSEICALTADDINGTQIRVDKAMVKCVDNSWIIKTTKTVSSTRDVEMPRFVLDLLPKEGALVSLNPTNITDRFAHAFDKLNIHRFRFHDLRHYAASIMHALGVPDVYIMKQGGWASDATLKNFYRGAIEDYQKLYTERAIGHFEKFNMQHKMQHNKEKAQ